METYKLKLRLLSDTTFARGDGVAGLVDAEVEHDGDGLPFLRGRALKGLLAEECANILFSLEQAQVPMEGWKEAAQQLFGRPGSGLDDNAGLHVGDARLPDDLRAAVHADVEERKYTPAEVLDSLTAIRRQTAMDPTGKPEEGSLRAMRVIVRETPLDAELHFDAQPGDAALPLLTACVHAMRRAGSGRNRGRGRVKLTLYGVDGTAFTTESFEEEVRRCSR